MELTGLRAKLIRGATGEGIEDAGVDMRRLDHR
jgi:hypothetical protein